MVGSRMPSSTSFAVASSWCQTWSEMFVQVSLSSKSIMISSSLDILHILSLTQITKEAVKVHDYIWLPTRNVPSSVAKYMTKCFKSLESGKLHKVPPTLLQRLTKYEVLQMSYCLEMSPGVVYSEPRLVLVTRGQRSDFKYGITVRGKPLNNGLLNPERHFIFSQYFLFGIGEKLNLINVKKSMY